MKNLIICSLFLTTIICIFFAINTSVNDDANVDLKSYDTLDKYEEHKETSIDEYCFEQANHLVDGWKRDHVISACKDNYK